MFIITFSSAKDEEEESRIITIRGWVAGTGAASKNFAHPEGGWS